MTSFHLFDPKKSEISDFFRFQPFRSIFGMPNPLASEATEGHLAEGTFSFALGLASWHHSAQLLLKDRQKARFTIPAMDTV